MQFYALKIALGKKKKNLRNQGLDRRESEGNGHWGKGADGRNHEGSSMWGTV